MEVDSAAAMEQAVRKLLKLDELSFSAGGHAMTNKKVDLPPGSKRNTGDGYEEVFVPARKPEPFADNEQLVAISSLPEWARPAFKVFSFLFCVVKSVDNNCIN